MTGWIIAFGIVFALAILPLGVSVIYNADGPLVRVIAGPVKITVVPLPKKKKKPKKKKETPPAEPDPAPASGQPEISHAEAAPKPLEPGRPDSAAGKEPQTAGQIPPPREPRESVAPQLKKQASSGGSWTDFLPLVKVAVNFLGDFRRKLRVKVLKLKLILGGGDPYNLAVNYGRAWAALGNLMPQLERFLVIGKRDVEVECDFTASETKVDVRLDISITLGRILALAVVYAVRALVEFLKIKKKRKGGAAT